jgi:DNA-binding transcriptional ArsR family regulator
MRGAEHDEELAETSEAGAHPALGIDRLIHEPARLVILAVLSGADEVDFRFLEAATGLTKGNLSRQAAKLEEAGYIAIRKYFKGRVPATGYRITPAGRAAFDAYWAQMNALQRSIQPRDAR